MAKLETQINQIYLINPEAKTASQVLYEEALSGSIHLFVVATLQNLKKKSEAAELKKISEIILACFRENKKLPAEALFEAALSQINQNLADLAHAGHKSWVGKFSGLICIKTSDNNIYLSSNGATAAWLKRKAEMIEIAPSEKLGTHPLKSFQNFTQGKLMADDNLILMTANIFNYVSFQLFTKILSRSTLEEACQQISKILQDSGENEQGFCGFFLNLTKKPAEALAPEIPAESPLPVAAARYQPVAEEIVPVATGGFSLAAWLSKFHLPRFSMPQSFHWPSWSRIRIKWTFFSRLSLGGKFFFLSFTVFFILFVVNLSLYGFRLRTQREADRVNAQATIVTNDISAVGSALIYKDQAQATTLFGQTEKDFASLKQLSVAKAATFDDQISQLSDQVNRISVVADPKVYATFTHHPLYLAKSATGFLLAGLDSNSVSSFDGTTNTDYFELNSLSENINSLAYWNTYGTTLALADGIYHVDSTLQQYEPVLPLPGDDITSIKTYNNNLYALDQKNGQVLRLVSSKGKISTTSVASGDFSQVRDIGVDKDIYLLSANKITKVSGGKLIAFPLPQMSDPITNATRIFDGANLYILEPDKKRVVIISKTGQLISQISFPSTDTPLDIYVDEGARSLYLLDDNQMFKITF